MAGSPEDEYPEHKKLKKLQAKSQACGEFLDWLRGTKGYRFYEVHEHNEGCYNPDPELSRQRVCGISSGAEMPVGYVYTTKLLAEFFGVDEEKLEQEKQAMLTKLRKANERTSPKSGDPGTRQNS